MNIKKNKIQTYIDGRGNLSVVDFSTIPFTPLRMFYINKVPKNEIRGNHSHYRTKQYLICLQGRVLVTLHDGHKEEKIILEKNEGVFINNLIWDSQKYLTDNDMILVLASTPYIKEDYIIDFKKFTKIINKTK
jgi:dTDP-4-dehydrorhamnose 3,5-epimerase-like enzyme